MRKKKILPVGGGQPQRTVGATEQQLEESSQDTFADHKGWGCVLGEIAYINLPSLFSSLLMSLPIMFCVCTFFHSLGILIHNSAPVDFLFIYLCWKCRKIFILKLLSL